MKILKRKFNQFQFITIDLAELTCNLEVSFASIWVLAVRKHCSLPVQSSNVLVLKDSERGVLKWMQTTFPYPRALVFDCWYIRQAVFVLSAAASSEVQVELAMLCWNILDQSDHNPTTFRCYQRQHSSRWIDMHRQRLFESGDILQTLCMRSCLLENRFSQTGNQTA